MKIQQLLCFREIARTNNFTTASGNLFLSQPSVSYNIREFEKELGVPLLNRSFSSAKVELTEYGAALLEPVEKILELMQECADTFEQLRKDDQTRFSLICSDSIVYGAIPDLIAYAYSHLPNGRSVFLKVDTVYSIADVEAKLMEETAALAMYANLPDDRFDHEPILKEEIVAYLPVGHPLLNKKVIRLSELGDMPVSLPRSDNSQLNERIRKMYEYEGLSPVIYEGSGVLLQNRLMDVSLGRCYTISVDFPINTRNYKTVRIESPFNSRDVYAIWRKDHELSETARCLIEYCKRYETNK